MLNCWRSRRCTLRRRALELDALKVLRPAALVYLGSSTAIAKTLKRNIRKGSFSTGCIASRLRIPITRRHSSPYLSDSDIGKRRWRVFLTVSTSQCPKVTYRYCLRPSTCILDDIKAGRRHQCSAGAQKIFQLLLLLRTPPLKTRRESTKGLEKKVQTKLQAVLIKEGTKRNETTESTNSEPKTWSKYLPFRIILPSLTNPTHDSWTNNHRNCYWWICIWANNESWLFRFRRRWTNSSSSEELKRISQSIEISFPKPSTKTYLIIKQSNPIKSTISHQQLLNEKQELKSNSRTTLIQFLRSDLKAGHFDPLELFIE